jgi:hypothetical protein
MGYVSVGVECIMPREGSSFYRFMAWSAAFTN